MFLFIQVNSFPLKALFGISVSQLSEKKHVIVRLG